MLFRLGDETMDDLPFVGLDGTEPSLATSREDERPRLEIASSFGAHGSDGRIACDQRAGAELWERELQTARVSSHFVARAGHHAYASICRSINRSRLWHRIVSPRMRYFDEPGHWLLVDISISALLYIVPSIAFRSGMGIGMAFMGFAFLAVVVAKMIFEIYLGVKKCRERRWKSVFYVKAISNQLLPISCIDLCLASRSKIANGS
jgi:hypothetical protein